MKHFVLIIAAFLLWSSTALAQEAPLTQEEKELIAQLQADSIKGQTGAIQLPSAHCTLSVPDGFVFLDSQSTKHLLVDYWDNPQEKLDGVLGAMVKADAGIFYNVETAYVVSYDNCGYVSDEDAEPSQIVMPPSARS